MAPWDRWRQDRYEARVRSLPTRIASTQPISESPNILLRGGSIAQPWQEKARYFGRTLGVIRFSAGLTASVIGRCPMVAERLTDTVHDRWAPDDDAVVNAVLRTYRNNRDSGQELVRRHAWHYQITGELLQSVEQTDRGVEWFVWSTASALIYPNKPVLLREMPGGSVFNGGGREVPAEQVNRFWQPDEEYPLLAVSPMIGILEDCDRYTILGRRTKREARSALGLNGAWFTPEKAHKYPVGPDGKPALYSQMDQDMAAIAEKGWDDDESLATLSPFSVHYDTDERTPPPQWIKIGQALDDKVLAARREALECIVRGLPIPNVIGIEGSSGAAASHWEGWLIAEEFFKSAVAPLADPIFHNDLTGSLLRPSLRRLAQAGAWQGNPEEWRVGYDPTPVIIHPDKASRAVELYKVGALSRLSTLLETGFGPEDAPTVDELDEFIKVQQALRTPRMSMADGGGPGMVTEGPPAQAALSGQLALAPYPSEVENWLDA